MSDRKFEDQAEAPDSPDEGEGQSEGRQPDRRAGERRGVAASGGVGLDPGSGGGTDIRVGTGDEGENDDSESAVQLPQVLPILPLKNTVLFPFLLSPLLVNTARSQSLIDNVLLRPDRLLVWHHRQPQCCEGGRSRCRHRTLRNFGGGVLRQ